jgi:quercetin dioxygenase-like cupin family protein
MAIGQERIIVQSGEGELIASVFGYNVIRKITAQQTSGAFSIVEMMYPPGNFTPPHRHAKTDEVGYVLEGELGFMVAEEDFRVGAGSFVVRPKGVPHAIWNITDRPAKLLDMYTPAGFEAYFQELASLASGSKPPTMEAIFEAGLRHDTVFMPELAPRLIQKFGLKLEIPGGRPPEPSPS